MIKKLVFSSGCLLLFLFAGGQTSAADSAAVAKTLTDLLYICKHVDFSDPETINQGTFYKAAPYIIYRGDDKARSWKDFANYANPEEKTGVDNVCFKINGSVNQDSAYTILKYSTETESEGTWHVLVVSYMKRGVMKKSAFAFLKIGNRYGLGDIDSVQ
jgi:hypothetical protein